MVNFIVLNLKREIMDIIEEKTQVFLKKLAVNGMKQKLILAEISKIKINLDSDYHAIANLEEYCHNYLELQKYKENLIDFIATLNSGNNEKSS
jgi:hypothetical protein